MRRILLSAMLASLVSLGAAATSPEAAAQSINRATFASNGDVVVPKNWRQWVFIGTPLTPSALNDGKAAFPEFHNVYIEPSAYAYWKRTGRFANGTQIAKELVLVRQKDKDDMNPDGSTAEVSGVGYFQGEFAGLGSCW